MKCYVTAFLALYLQLKFSAAQNQSLIVDGPKYNVFVGDVENFTCIVENGLPESYKINWYFIYKDGIHDSVASSEIFDDYLSLQSHQRLTYIKIKSEDIKSIACIVSSPNSKGSMKEEFQINLRDPQVLTKFPTVCEETEERPTIILQRFSYEPSSSYYWASHFVTNAKVALTDPVSSFTLKCFSKIEPVEWTVTKKPTAFRYRTSKYVNSVTKNECYQAILEIGQVNLNSSQSYVCRSPNNTKYQSFIDMDASSVTPTKIGSNGTLSEVEQCLLLLLTGESGSGLTGLSITSSLTSIFLLFGIIYIKRKLNLQKDKLKDIVDKQAEEVGANL